MVKLFFISYFWLMIIQIPMQNILKLDNAFVIPKVVEQVMQQTLWCQTVGIFNTAR